MQILGQFRKIARIVHPEFNDVSKVCPIYYVDMDTEEIMVIEKPSDEE